MEIIFAVAGKTTEDYLERGEKKYLDRLKHYINIKMVELPQKKKGSSLSPGEHKKHESKQMIKLIDNADHVILLDERGYQYGSVDFSIYLQKLMNRGMKSLLFIAGGPYGFHEDVLKKAHSRLSLSKMTFSHQMVRLFFLEQLYRSFTIMKGESYHNP